MLDIAPRTEPPAPPTVRGFGMATLAACTVAALLPFVNKAFHVDDPLFSWAARQCQSAPWDFYGVTINWDDTNRPMHSFMQNPPGMSWFLALAAAVVGWSEPALHLVCLAPAVAAVCGTWALARRLCGRPDVAAMAVLTAPAFLVSSTNVMCDTLLVAWWVWGIELWLAGLENRSRARLAAGAVLVAAAALTKYFGVSLIPLLLAYTLANRRRMSTEMLYLLIPAAVLAFYQWWTWNLYGHGLLLDAASYSVSRRAGFDRPWWMPMLNTFGFCGGGLFPVLAFAPLVVRGRTLAGLALGGFALTMILATAADAVPVLEPENPNAWPVALQLGLYVAGAVLILGLAARDLWERHDAKSLLIALWIAGTIVFAVFLNWTVSARILLPLAPAVGILLARKVETAGSAQRTLRWWKVALPAALSLAVAWTVAWADQSFADSAREGARQVLAFDLPGRRTVWFTGHWGFQYYMERGGARPLTRGETRLEPHDAIVIPRRNADVFIGPSEIIRSRGLVTVPVPSWVATMETEIGAGFYSDNFGPLPFAVGRSPPVDGYRIGEITGSATLEADGTWYVEPPIATTDQTATGDRGAGSTSP